VLLCSKFPGAEQRGKSHKKEVERLQKRYAPKASPAKEAKSLNTPTQSAPAKTPEKAPLAEKVTVPAATQTVNVSFALLEPDAKQVALGGDFNGWSTDATPMKRKESGLWETTVALAPGRYQYKFILDGHWLLEAGENVWNEHGTLNSVLEVRA
jgi:hypothetical protein